MSSNHLILCHPFLLLSSIFPSIRVFPSESAIHITWPQYWSFSFSITPSDEYSGLISFKMDWLDLLVVQGTLKSFLQHHNSKASILLCSAFFMVQLSHPYMTTGKTTAVIIGPFLASCLYFLIHCLGLSLLFFQGVSIFFFCIKMSNCFRNISWNNNLSSIEMSLHFCQRSTGHIVVSLFLVSLFVPLSCVCDLSPVLHFLNHCSLG